MTSDNRVIRQNTIDKLAEDVRKLDPGTDAYNELCFKILKEKCWLGQMGVSVRRRFAAVWWNSVYPDQEPIRSKDDPRLASACNEYLAHTLSDCRIFDQRYTARRASIYDKYAGQVICYPLPWQPIFTIRTERPS